jgi:hypothetical protein
MARQGWRDWRLPREYCGHWRPSTERHRLTLNGPVRPHGRHPECWLLLDETTGRDIAERSGKASADAYLELLSSRGRPWTVLGIPLWLGLKRRVALKYLRRRFGRKSFRWLLLVKLGDLFSSHEFGNHRLIDIDNWTYERLGRGWYLEEADVTGNDDYWGGLEFCRVGPPTAAETLARERDRIVGRLSNCSEPDCRQAAWRFSREVMTINPDGTVTIAEKISDARFDIRGKVGQATAKSFLIGVTVGPRLVVLKMAPGPDSGYDAQLPVGSEVTVVASPGPSDWLAHSIRRVDA